MIDFVGQGGKYGGQTVRRIISKGLTQTRGGGNGSAKAYNVPPSIH